MAHTYYPAFINIAGRTCIVVGGGDVAQRKVDQLLEAGGAVTVISPSVTARLAALAARGEVRHLARPFQAGDLGRAFLAIAATDQSEVNRAVYDEAQRTNVLVNSVDDPARCTFIAPAVVRRGPVTIAISTDGRSPGLARRMREEIDAIFPPEHAAYLEQMVELRERVRQELASMHPQVREHTWRALMNAGLLDLIRAGRRDEVEAMVAAAVDEARSAE